MWLFTGHALGLGVLAVVATLILARASCQKRDMNHLPFAVSCSLFIRLTNALRHH